jgi:hypothetical protein
MSSNAIDRNRARAIVRGGVLCICVAALVALICSTLPGYEVEFAYDNLECYQSVHDHGLRERDRCFRVDRHAPTRRAGTGEGVTMAMLALLLAAPVYRRGSARAAAGWGLLVWIGLLVHERVSSQETLAAYLVPHWPAIVLRWALLPVVFGPFVLALASVSVRSRWRWSRQREPIPRDRKRARVACRTEDPAPARARAIARCVRQPDGD